MGCSTPVKNIPFQFELNEHHVTITSQGGANFQYKIEALRDLYCWLKVDCQGDWVQLGSINEQSEPVENSVEAWARSYTNSVGGYYGITHGMRGRFASFIPAILKKLGFVEFDSSNPRKVRAL